MNLQEFAALKKGDKIENNAMNGTSTGTVIAVDGQGVHVAWGKPDAMPFGYSVQSTAWFHWTKLDEVNE